VDMRFSSSTGYILSMMTTSSGGTNNRGDFLYSIDLSNGNLLGRVAVSITGNPITNTLEGGLAITYD
jgi:hypothetical protein